MASPHEISLPDASGARTGAFAVRVLAALALVVVAPLILLVAVVVRVSSPGRVLVREPGWDRHGRHTDLLAFRTTIDGAGTATHERLRELVGADADAPLTGPGPLLRALRLDRLPRLLNVAAGHSADRR